MIGNSAFSHTTGQERIIVPPSVRKLEGRNFKYIDNVKFIEVLGKSVEIGGSCFSYCSNLTSVIFPNSEHPTLARDAMDGFPKLAKLFCEKNRQVGRRRRKKLPEEAEPHRGTTSRNQCMVKQKERSA